MSSGVAVAPECQIAYQDLKTTNALKTKNARKFIIFRVSDDKKTIVVDDKTDQQFTQSTDGNEDEKRQEEYNHFVGLLPKDECRWAVYDLEYELDGGAGKRKKLVFLIWSPDTAKISVKMLYASSKDALRRGLDGIAFEVQATDQDEVAYGPVVEKARRGGR